MDAFECAFGRCTVSDGVVTIERADPETMGRRTVLRTAVATSWEHQPRRTALRLGSTALLGLVYLGLVASFSTAFAVEPPLVGGLGLLGVLALLGPLEVTYRRAVRERRQIRRRLAGERRVSSPAQIPLDDITGVSIRTVSTGTLFSDGHILVIDFHDAGAAARTYLGFPEFMSAELATARSLFEHHGIPVTAKTHDG